MMPAALRNKGDEMHQINAKPQLPHCNIEEPGRVDFSRFAHATRGIHESSQRQLGLTKGWRGPSQASLRFGSHLMKREYRRVTKILSSQTGICRADLYCLSDVALNSYASARKPGLGVAHPTLRTQNS
jgi:hypothetical protein